MGFFWEIDARNICTQIGVARREKGHGYTFAVFPEPSSRVQLFLFLNDLAGRWPLLDGAARLFYVGAVPVLGTLVLVQLMLSPRSTYSASRSKTALTLLLALVLGSVLAWGFDWLATQLHLGVLSPRPWMTRRVNWLVVEPQDNSFPSIEVVFAAVLACASWRLNRRIGTGCVLIVALFGLVRLFCGNNYFADVFVGAALGVSSFALCSQALRRYSTFGQRARDFSLCASPLTVTLVGCYLFALFSPRFEGKLGLGTPPPAAPAPVLTGAASTGSSVTQGEGEGEGMAPEEGRAEELALAKRSSLFLPQVEAFLRGKLTSIARPFPLLAVEVAPVKAGTTTYRCAAIRFEVPVGERQTRPLVADRAARLVQAAFALDSQMQSVDIIAVARDEGRNLDGSQMSFAGDEVPVFTASIQRKDLIVRGPAWLNAPGVDGGSWLRARSRIYINGRVLPPLPMARVVTPATAAPRPQLTPQAKGTPQPQKTPFPSSTTSAKAKASPPPRPTPTALAPKVSPGATPRSTLRPQTTRIAPPRATATPRFFPAPSPTRKISPPKPTTAPTTSRAARPTPTPTTSPFIRP